MKNHKTQVVIIGGGPAGLMLSHTLDLLGIDNIVLERQSREYVQKRIRAGVLEAGSVKFIRDVGLGENMDKNGHEHDGVLIEWQDKPDFLIDTQKYTGKRMMAYGQTALTIDLYNAREKAGGAILDNATDVQPHDITTERPYVTFTHKDEKKRIDCDFICACDGYHGVGRQSIPSSVRKEYEMVYPFGWLGVMVEKPPLKDFIYAYHQKGFALAAQRNPNLSRYYIQVPNGADINEWDDDRFWEDLKSRFSKETADQIQTGPTIEKSIAPLRSFVSEPMRYGNLFLCGDAAHIVPPTGAKGLNLAMSDVFYMQRALEQHYNKNNDNYLESYSEMALRRVWSASQISWYLTKLLHTFPDSPEFEQKLQSHNYDHLLASEATKKWLCELYVGLPYEN